MRIVNKMISPQREAVYEEIKVYDNLDEYLKDYTKSINQKYWIRIGYENWEKEIINCEILYHFKYDDIYLTKNVYLELLDNCQVNYNIYARDFSMTSSSCSFTGNCESEKECIEYMKDPNKSWLLAIKRELDECIKEYKEDIKNIEKKIEDFENKKKQLYDEEYLKSKIKKEYKFDYKKYLEKKEK